MPEAVIVSAARSPIGRAYKGSLTQVRPDDLAAHILRSALDKVPALDPALIEDILVGCGLPGGEQGFNIARAIAVLLGLDGVPGATVNRFCASSLQTTRMAFHAIRAGEADVVVSAGVECVSRLTAGNPDSEAARNPLLSGQGMSQGGIWQDPRDQRRSPNLYMDMGTTAENVAGLYGVTREHMDEFAFWSQRKAEASRVAGFWDRDITPVPLPDGTLLAKDDAPRPSTTLEGLAALDPIFREDGLVTAGNACGINDGAAALVLMSDTKARELGIVPLARIVSTAATGLSPEIMGLGPVEASRKALALAGMTVNDIDQFELNEAFAAQVLPSQRELGIPDEKLNVNGGAIALGHPYGMTGARITTTLMNSLVARDQQFGLETMCVAGGMGMAMVIERLS